MTLLVVPHKVSHWNNKKEKTLNGVFHFFFLHGFNFPFLIFHNAKQKVNFPSLKRESMVDTGKRPVSGSSLLPNMQQNTNQPMCVKKQHLVIKVLQYSDVKQPGSDKRKSVTSQEEGVWRETGNHQSLNMNVHHSLFCLIFLCESSQGFFSPK